MCSPRAGPNSAPVPTDYFPVILKKDYFPVLISSLVGYPNFLLRRRPVVLALCFFGVHLTDSISIEALAEVFIILSCSVWGFLQIQINFRVFLFIQLT